MYNYNRSDVDNNNLNEPCYNITTNYTSAEISSELDTCDSEFYFGLTATNCLGTTFYGIGKHNNYKLL